ncbi:hypothetical protein ABER61_00530 [Brevibacillus formosus]|uniref:Uncharacterized protein n=1 Tax=Brevibacillus formosus TaxID=54913 RepID=A0A837KIY5_9BACL|nr:hypothetical protein [Brevibacillus formosus]KLH97414.1 hypothetical protein AA984_19935 [Brevibacillus formosus]PSJ96770.1 hypothetical protein C7R91_10965 [Brevibacillus formosus]GED59945.1 hypothetical protein BFO01nite_40770 [Brevibacillus formosus]
MLRSSDCWNSTTHKEIIEYSSRLLWRFIQPNAKENETEEAILNLTGLNKRELNMLANVRFLLSKEVKYLLNEIAPKIINRLSKESIYEHITERGKVKGRIDWQRTISARAAAGNDSSLYVYSRRAQIFDLPENRLFLYIIKHINEKARNFVTEEYLNVTWYSEIDDGEKWREKIDVIASKTNHLLRNPFISKIGHMLELTDKAVDLTKKCRPPHYRELAIIAERLAFCQRSPSFYLKEELDGNILEPLNKDTIFEIAVLFKTINVAIKSGWKEKHVGLIGAALNSISTLVKNDSELRIYYQKLPRDMARISKYGVIMADYGLSEKLRRPDIVLEFINGQRKDFFIIEVKRSKSRDYLVDGTYKLLGYLKDFEQINKGDSTLRGFLVGWSGIPFKEYINNEEVQLFNWDNIKEGLTNILETR